MKLEEKMLAMNDLDVRLKKKRMETLEQMKTMIQYVEFKSPILPSKDLTNVQDSSSSDEDESEELMT